MAHVETEVAIAGAGPAGSSLAGFLRLAGRQVTVFERERFPRFHIGESLQPMCIPALLELGVDLAREEFALHKPGAVFFHAPSGESLRIRFTHALEGSFPFAYQVERAPFDHALARRAEALGADVRYACAVDDWREDARGVDLCGSWGTCRAQVLVDATGQQAVVGRRQRTMQPLDRFGLCASFTTFIKVDSAAARGLLGEGDIGHELRNGSWNWMIPLPGQRVSVGLVERDPRPGATAEEVLSRCITESPLLARVFEGAERIAPFRRIANYSYYNLAPRTPRSVSVGDARAFLDPIFSSGVTIALLSARLLAREIDAALRDDRPLELADHLARCDVAYTTFDRLIERFYRPQWLENVFFAPDKEDRLVREITSILAGDVWRDDNGLQSLLLKSRPRSGWGSEVAR